MGKIEFHKAVLSLLCVITLTLCIPVHLFAGIVIKSRYVAIDSLSMNHISCHVNLDLKSKNIIFPINNQLLTFVQEYDIDTSSFKPQHITYKFEDGQIILNTTELLFVDRDSIYVSAIYQQFNEKYNIGRPVKIAKLAIGKSELLGVAISPPKKEMKKRRNRYHLITGIFTVIFTAIVILTSY